MEAIVYLCPASLVVAVVGATISTVREVRKAARKRGIDPDATGWNKINASVHAWSDEDQAKKQRKRDAEEEWFRRNPHACRLCRSRRHSTQYHWSR
ncbi:hypothetical protein KOI35_19040 [Actinoplanes bogorensis]|uniref:Uncharacterized protein n=1 Tax=Paractinoplanes bogorensis TaxID=1610840 RepID=A0ABS5YU62_9ACTN|nr:hypothetical protein [Actinoplanes bogorensis]MBU2665610.1 hypothetical protein [Actinoplanes bogorensis]